MDRETRLQQVPNFRDVGKTVNQFLGERSTRSIPYIPRQVVSPSTDSPADIFARVSFTVPEG